MYLVPLLNVRKGTGRKEILFAIPSYRFISIFLSIQFFFQIKKWQMCTWFTTSWIWFNPSHNKLQYMGFSYLVYLQTFAYWIQKYTSIYINISLPTGHIFYARDPSHNGITVRRDYLALFVWQLNSASYDPSIKTCHFFRSQSWWDKLYEIKPINQNKINIHPFNMFLSLGVSVETDNRYIT